MDGNSSPNRRDTHFVLVLLNFIHFLKVLSKSIFFVATMVHHINIHNKSARPQLFEVHGWNNNENITVKGGATAVIQADDRTSGAIIAVHDGREGEQAEITKDGYGGKDYA